MFNPLFDFTKEELHDLNKPVFIMIYVVVLLMIFGLVLLFLS